ncbi:RNA polymerase sigma factor sigV [uncultured Clostridium sp.]|nr:MULTISPECIES: sigma-70 family RNA polymerase sigma factor [unclassified Clostridium]SCI79257.1 RNA polymerase sigma factor sigV [uncultured Clostridium sp.]
MGIWTAWELPGFRLLRWLQALIWAFMPGVKDENRQNMVEKEEWEARMRQAETNGRAEMILTRFGDSILRYAYTYLHNMSDAEEVLQDTLVQFLKTAPEFESENHEKAWLLRVAANLSKNRIRYNKLRETDELNDELVAEEREDLSFVWEAVKSLPVKYREVIHLFYHEGYQTAQIAKVLGRNESTVRSDLRRGREKLKEVLKGEYDFEEI